MGVESQVYTQLAATTALTDVVSTRIHRYGAPRAPTKPYVTFRRLETETENGSTGAATTLHCRMMVDTWSDDMDTCRTAADAVTSALNDWTNSGGTPSISKCHIMSDVDLTEEPDEASDALLFHIRQDFEIWYGA